MGLRTFSTQIRGSTPYCSCLQYLRYGWEDLLWIAIIALLTATINRFMPTYRLDQRTILLRRTIGGSFLPSDAYLYTQQSHPRWMHTDLNAVIITIVPILVFGALQIKLKSVWDFHAAVTGVMKAIFAAYGCPLTSSFF